MFKKEFKITINDFTALINWILETITMQMRRGEDNYSHINGDRIDIQSYKTILLFTSSMLLEKQKIHEKFGYKYEKILDRLTFQPERFDENQLQYNLIARQPLIDKGDIYIISPEILLDSLFVNSHYSLLESKSSNVKDEYKNRYSKKFVEKIAAIAVKQGYNEFAKELELYEGKNQIGDFDLVLKNSKNEFLLIEAKNHSVPMDVYFHDQEATEKRLTQLKNEWEKKVHRRRIHLEANHSKYGISSNFRYIIVSKMPEILSHFSDYLVLSLNEFQNWINMNDPSATFEDIFKSVYKIDENQFTEEELTTLQKELFTGWRFEKE